MKYSIQEDDLSQVENSMVIGDDEETIVVDPDYFEYAEKVGAKEIADWVSDDIHGPTNSALFHLIHMMFVAGGAKGLDRLTDSRLMFLEIFEAVIREAGKKRAKHDLAWETGDLSDMYITQRPEIPE